MPSVQGARADTPLHATARSGNPAVAGSGAGQAWTAPGHRPAQTSGPTGPSSRPGPVELLVYGSLLVLGLVGLASPGIYNLLPAESLLEGVFLLAAVLSMARIDVAARSFLLVALLYATVKVALMALGTSGAWLDFVQAYKAYFYLLGLAFFIRKGMFDGRRLARFSCVLVVLFFAKYAYSVVLGGLDARPGIYTENNFELVLLMGLFYLGFPYAGRWRHPLFVLLTATVLISASRSAALGLVIVYVGLYLRLRNRFWPLHVVGLAGLGAAVVAVFIARNPQGLRSLDRFNFLQVFLWETRNWPIWEFVTGSYPLTPLSPGSCSRLASYTNEFSLSNTGACYSVILHSYLMRAAFDQGLLGLALLYVLVWLGLARSGAGRRDILVLLGVLTASGLSVSSFNNVFAVLTLAIAFGLRRPVTSAVLPAAWHRAPPAAPRDRGSQLLVGGATDSWVHPLVEARPQHSQQPAGRRNVVTVSSNPLHQSVDHVGPGKASFAEQELAHLRISIFIGCTRFSRRGRIRSARSSIKPLRATGIDVVVLHPPPRTRVPIRVPRVRLLP